MAHEIAPDEIEDLQRWLHETLPPKRATGHAASQTTIPTAETTST